MSLDRFVEAQARAWPRPVEEIRAGRKTSHWMWYIFPQLSGLGQSPMAQLYGIDGLAEARDYLRHPVLGPRLIEIAQAMLAHEGVAPETVLGPIDAMKLLSCATLFEAAGGDAVFAALLDAFYGGTRCPKTLKLLGDAT